MTYKEIAVSTGIPFDTVVKRVRKASKAGLIQVTKKDKKIDIDKKYLPIINAGRRKYSKTLYKISIKKEDGHFYVQHCSMCLSKAKQMREYYENYGYIVRISKNIEDKR